MMQNSNRHLAPPPDACRRYRLHLVAGILLVICGMSVDERLYAAGFWNGLQLMQEVQRRQRQYPYVYEEHSIIQVDGMGQRDTRQARLYSRLEDNGELRILYIFEAPQEIKGVTLIATRKPDGETDTAMYLPALGDRFIESSWAGSGGNFLGTDFSVEDLTAENLKDYEYVRRDDNKIDGVDYFIVDVFHAGRNPEFNIPLKRHYIRQDIFFITRTDYFDMQGRLSRQMTKYDLKQLDDEMWRAGITIMENKKLNHQSIIKVDRRVFSVDYVPEEMFSRDWVLANYPPLQSQQAAQADTGTIVPNGGQENGESLSSAKPGADRQDLP